MEQANRALDLDQTFFFPHFAYGWIDIDAGKINDAIPELRKADMMESPPFVAGWLGYAYGATGDRVSAMAMIEELNHKSLHGYVPPFNLAHRLSRYGRQRRALDYLEQAYQRTPSGYAGSRWIVFSILCAKSHASSR